MAITVKELVESRNGREAIDSRRIVVEYSRIFVVWETGGAPASLRLGPKTVIDEVKAFTGLALGSIYQTSTETDTRAILQSFDPQVAEGHVWNCTLNYSSRLDISPGDLIENPQLRPPRITSGTNSYSVTKRFDANGKAVVNSAKDYFDPLPQVNEPYGKFSVQRNFGQDNYFVLMEHVNTVNDAQFYAFPAGTLRISDFSQEGPLWENGVQFWSVRVDFEHKPEQANKKVSGTTKDVDGWNTLLLDAGYNEISGTTTTAILDADGKDTTVPRLLDGAGAALTAFTASDVSYEEFEFHLRKDFSALGII